MIDSDLESAIEIINTSLENYDLSQRVEEAWRLIKDRLRRASNKEDHIKLLIQNYCPIDMPYSPKTAVDLVTLIRKMM